MEPIRPNVDFATANRDIIRVLHSLTPYWIAGWLLAVTGLVIGAYSWYTQITYGMGMAGMNNSSFWGTYIVTFVFWVGIGHAGTLISAILFLVR